MFVVFIVFTMGITKWAAKRNTFTTDYYSAGGSITGFQNSASASSRSSCTRRQAWNQAVRLRADKESVAA